MFEYVIFHSKRDFANMIEIMDPCGDCRGGGFKGDKKYNTNKLKKKSWILRWGDHSGLSGWAQSNV